MSQQSYPEERILCTHLVGESVGPRASSVREISLPLSGVEIEILEVQPVV
jgi:hypothetical protein